MHLALPIKKGEGDGKMENSIGSYYVLSVLPIWVTALILYMVTQGVLFILRDRCEGLYYNTSYSAVLGDGALVVIVLMAAEILQRGAPWPVWGRGGFFESGFFHITTLCAGILLGTVWLALDRPPQWGDRYHHAVIAPLLTYLSTTLVPVIFLKGTGMEITATIFLILLWVGLVVYDVRTDRLDQRNYRNLGSHLNAVKDYPKYRYYYYGNHKP
ncbi:hypothetical protein KKG24_02550 [Patescibacteria group bacterium]|nr:hypothetical protein [Patescibacteria group bacterium]